MGWTKLGKGAFNFAYKSDDGKSVFKVQQDASEKTDTPDRSVRLWNEINPHLPPPATVTEDKELGKGWICPFVEGRQSADNEMSDALVSIFNNTGRIIVDAISPRNFITTNDGKVMCIDIGMALQMENREEEVCLSTRGRRKSVVSLETWQGLHYEYNAYFERGRDLRPLTVDTIKALLFIKANRPDIFDVSFLKTDPSCVSKLVRAYDRSNGAFHRQALTYLDQVVSSANKSEPEEKTPPEIRQGKETLKEKRPINLDNIKESCIKELERYINSRGSIHEGKFKASLITRFFRNLELTSDKVGRTQNVIANIQNASSIGEITNLISAAQTDPVITKAGSIFSSNLGAKLGKCAIILENAKQEGLTEDNTFKPAA